MFSYLDARNIAISAHKGQVRKCGEAYINHPLRVAAAVKKAGADKDVVLIAMLHDVVEDSDVSLFDLLWEGASPRVVEGIDALSRNDDEEYFEYIARLVKNPDARVVKAADLADNMNENCPPSLLARYAKAKDILEAV